MGNTREASLPSHPLQTSLMAKMDFQFKTITDNFTKINQVMTVQNSNIFLITTEKSQAATRIILSLKRALMKVVQKFKTIPTTEMPQAAKITLVKIDMTATVSKEQTHTRSTTLLKIEKEEVIRTDLQPSQDLNLTISQGTQALKIKLVLTSTRKVIKVVKVKWQNISKVKI